MLCVMSNPIFAAHYNTYDEFFAEFGSDAASYVDPDSKQTALTGALANADFKARYAIANRLLDEGADPAYVTSTPTNALHAALGRRKHDWDALAPLLRRLLDGGADPNLVAPKFGTPLQMIANLRGMTEDQLAPIYDVFFARDDLDLLKQAEYGQSPLALARKRRDRLPELSRRMEQYLHERGIEVPKDEEE